MEFTEKKELVKRAQTILNINKDGISGFLTWKAIGDFIGVETKDKPAFQIVPLVQKELGLVADGKDGKLTWSAIVEILEAEKPTQIVAKQEKYKKWPKGNSKAITDFYGKMGENLVSIDLPYPMVLAWDTKEVVNKMTCHQKCAEAFKSMFQDILEHYGIEEIKRLGLDKFGGCFNKRKMRGGSEWSHHSWACVLDLDPDRNQLKWGKDKAQLAKPEYKAFWDIVYSHGMTGLGPERNYDFMHVGCIDYRK